MPEAKRVVIVVTKTLGQIEKVMLDMLLFDAFFVPQRTVGPVGNPGKPLRVVFALVDQALGTPRRRNRPAAIDPRRIEPVSLKRSHHHVARAYICRDQFITPPAKNRVGGRVSQGIARFVGYPVKVLFIRLLVLLAKVQAHVVSEQRPHGQVDFDRVVEKDRFPGNHRRRQGGTPPARYENLVLFALCGKRRDAGDDRKGHRL